MPAPTFVAEYESVWNTTGATKTASVTVAVNDYLVIYAVAETVSGTETGWAPSGGSLTYTSQRFSAISSSCQVQIWTAPSASAQTFTLTMTKNTTTTVNWGFNALRFSGATGVGATAVLGNTTATTMAITTTGANPSSLIWVDGDWTAIDGTSTRAYSTATAGAFTEQTFNFLTTKYTVYGGFHADAGAAGAKTVGLTAPTGTKNTFAAVELLGTAAVAIGAGVRRPGKRRW